MHWDSLDPGCTVENIQLAFDILESELGLQPVTTAEEVGLYFIVILSVFVSVLFCLSLDPGCTVENIQLAFDILESELGLQPVTTAEEVGL